MASTSTPAVPPRPATYTSFTAPINPPSATPRLSASQIWAALQLKVSRAELFVPQAIRSTRVLSVSQNAQGQRVTERLIQFAADGRELREQCTEKPGLAVDFAQPCGGMVRNILSEGEGGELFLTYTFEYFEDEAVGEDELGKLRETKRKMARGAVEGTIEVIRRLVRDGEI